MSEAVLTLDHVSKRYVDGDRTIDALETWLSARAFVCGDRFTMADVYVGSAVDWGQQFGTIPARPAFVGYAERLRSREAYQAGKAIDNALMAEIQGGAES